MKIKIDGAIVLFIPETQEEIKDLKQKTPPNPVCFGKPMYRMD
jgi:hypothetical protein